MGRHFGKKMVEIWSFTFFTGNGDPFKIALFSNKKVFWISILLWCKHWCHKWRTLLLTPLRRSHILTAYTPRLSRSSLKEPNFQSWCGARLRCEASMRRGWRSSALWDSRRTLAKTDTLDNLPSQPHITSIGVSLCQGCLDVALIYPGFAPFLLLSGRWITPLWHT